jgi:hypothetical protein
MKSSKLFFATAALLSTMVLVGCKDDEVGIAPTITLSDPVDNAIGVSVGQAIAITFSEPMDPASINPSSITLAQNGTAVAGTVTYTSPVATFTPAAQLLGNKLYNVTVTTDVKDQSGMALAVSHTFSFTTGAAPDVLLPLISITSPVNNTTGIARNASITVEFSEPMQTSTINSASFTLAQGSNAVSGSVVYSGTTATFTPTNVLNALTVYAATITTAAKDLAGNSLSSNTSWNFTTGGTSSTLATVALGESGNYVILAKTAINNVATSAITGDLGLSPAATSYVTGFSVTNATGYATSAQVTGKIYAADMATPTPINLTTAVNDMITAYNDAAGRPSPDFNELATGNIGGRTLTPGLYKWTNTVTAPANFSISGGPNDIWIFQIAGNLTISSAVNVTLSGGAQARNIFWQVAGQTTLGTTVHFEGTILSMTGITLQTGASITGRALAQTAVVLDGNAVSNP